ncbi:MAG: acyloxyacyl hydrolase [Halomonas sp.]|uniref:acyloxyacyl hydrolase n=1 Tax=Halomonas sp. TaxID=1486246 RepID=UPI002ACD89AA|nr:acyloxyacyl hydrolase [Halomonas sp.]MDZ7851530.1 acyloxyacyl hydrolase [Halomonas sp.]
MTSRRHLAAIMTAAALFSSGSAQAVNWALEAGATSEDTAALGVMVHNDESLLSDWLSGAWRLGLSTGVQLYEGDRESDNAAWIVRPALRYTAQGGIPWFAEAGIGAALFLDTRLESRDLGSAFQFEDRLALGMPLGSGELRLSVRHYSNADIKLPNEGFEVLSLGYRLGSF